MNCKKCGKTIPDDAVFCPYCGQPQNQNAVDENRWEICEIDWDEKLGGFETLRELGSVGQENKRVRLIAKATGVNGPYKAAEGDHIDERNLKEKTKIGEKAVKKLITKLRDDGWELIIESDLDPWYSYKFRRQVI